MPGAVTSWWFGKLRNHAQRRDPRYKPKDNALAQMTSPLIAAAATLEAISDSGAVASN